MSPGRSLRAILLWAAAAAVMGLAARGIDLGYLPSARSRTILVEVQCRDLFEQQIEAQILEPLEQAIGTLRGVREVFSVAEREQARILVRFLDTVDLDEAYLDLREVLDRARLSFPENVQRPTVVKSDGTGAPVFVASFPLHHDPEDLRRAYEQVQGAGEIEIGGGWRSEITVRLDPQRLAAAGLGAAQVVQGIRGANAAGSLAPVRTDCPGSSPGDSWVVDGRFRDLDDLRALALGPARRLSDVAEVELTRVRPSGIGRVNGSESLLLFAHAAGDANVVSLTRRFSRAAAGFEGAAVLFDSGERIEQAIGEVVRALLVGAGLVVLLTVLYCGRLVPALIVSGSIPLSALAAVAALRGCGQSLDLMSLCGVAVGIGMVVDAGLLCLDACLRLGSSGSAVRRELRGPVLCSTATTLAVFVPLAFAPPALGGRFTGLALAVAASLLTSVLYVFTLMPVLLGLARCAGPPAAASDRCVRLRRPSGRGRAARLRRGVGRMVAATMLAVHRRRALCSAAAAAALAGAAAVLLGLPLRELATEPRTALRFSTEFASGLGASAVFRRAADLESTLQALPGVRSVSASYERERARFCILLDSARHREEVVRFLRSREAQPREGFVFLPQGQSEWELFDVTLSGPEAAATRTAALRQATTALADAVANLPQVRSVVLHFKDPPPAYVLEIDPLRSARLGIVPRQAAAQLFWAVSYPVADKWTTGPAELDIRVGASPAQPDLDTVLELPFITASGAVTRAGLLARSTAEPQEGRIYRLNRRRALSFSVAAHPGAQRRALRAVRRLAETWPLPAGYAAEVGASQQERAREVRAAALCLALALLLILCILVFLFESPPLALAVMLQVPLSFVLPAVLLPLLRLPLCTPTVMGLILTAGLAVNNAIVVLDPPQARRLTAGPLAWSLARKAPVVCAASLTTVLAALPLAFAGQAGSGILAPLSLTLAAGVAGSLLALPLGLALVCRSPGR